MSEHIFLAYEKNMIHRDGELIGVYGNMKKAATAVGCSSYKIAKKRKPSEGSVIVYKIDETRRIEQWPVNISISYEDNT